MQNAVTGDAYYMGVKDGALGQNTPHIATCPLKNNIIGKRSSALLHIFHE